MRIKRAQDLYDVMYPIFIISKVLGLAPYQLHLKDERRLTAHIGIITIARFILIVGTMCYVCFVMDELNFSVNIGGMALRYELYFGTIMTAIVLVLSMTNQKPAIKSITMLKELDADFEQIGFHISYKNAQIFCYAQIVFMLFMFMAMVTLQPFSGSLAYFVIYSIFNVVDVINTTMLFQYVDVLLLIRQRFIWLNRKIRDLSDFSKTIITVHNETHLTHGMPVNVTRRKLETRNLITNLAKIHGKLFAVAKITNRIYGVQLLVTITIRFVMITTQLINTYKLIQDPKLADSVTHSIVAIYLFLHFSKIFMVAAVSENTACKVSYYQLMYTYKVLNL